MKNRVLYVSKENGSAKRVADSIAAGIAQAASSIEKHTAVLDVGLLFIGCEVNEAGAIKGGIRKILNKITSEQVKMVVGFATSSSGTGSPKAAMKAILDPKGIKYLDEEFLCKGKTAFGNRNCPTEQDLKNAKDFSSKIGNSYRF